MKKNDPRLTAYALGELGAEETREVRAAILQDKSLAREVEQIQLMASELTEVFGEEAEYKLSANQRANIFASGSDSKIEDISSARAGKWRGFAIGTGVAAALTFGLYQMRDGGVGTEPSNNVDFAAISVGDLVRPMFAQSSAWSHEAGASVSKHAKGAEKAMSHQAVDFKKEVSKRLVASSSSGGRSGSYVEAKWLGADEQQSLTFPMISGNASWYWVKDAVQSGKLPAPGSVRVEEMVNCFDYPKVDGLTVDGVSISAEVVECPWKAGNLVAVLQFQNQTKKTVSQLAAGMTVAQGIERFRIVGYRAQQSGAVQAPEVLHAQAGYKHALVVELQPKQALEQNATALTIHLRVGDSDVKSIAANYQSVSWQQASPAVQFVLGVATWGQFLGKSPSLEEMPKEKFSQMISALDSQSDFSAKQKEALKMMRKSLAMY